MRIHTPVLSRAGGKVRLSARVETDRGGGHLPPEIWFEVPIEFELLIYTGIESFVVALLPYAMSLAEDIHVDEPFSPQLAFHIRDVCQVLVHLEPRLFNPIEIRHGGFSPQPPPRAAGVGLTFSGGVDAYYSLLRNLKSAQTVPGFAVTHGIFVFGFDLPDSKLESYREALAVYQAQFERIGLTLIPAAFNVYDFRPPKPDFIRWYWLLRTHPIGLTGLGLFLSKGLGRLIMASSQQFDTYGDGFGGDFEIQTSLSTEWMEVIHDSLVENRTEKTIALADWPETYDSLRVCLWDPNGVRNCGRCPKCVRTTATLEAIGKLDRYSTFPKPFRPSLILRSLTGLRGGYYLVGIRQLARENGRNDLVRLLSIALIVSRQRARLKRLITRINPNFKNPGR